MDAEQFAEDAMAYVPLSPSARRQHLETGCLSYQPGGAPVFANVSAVRARDSDGLRELSREAAEWFGELGRTTFAWFLGPSSTPFDAAAVLLAAGAKPIGMAPKAMVLDQEPAADADVDIREVTSAAQFLLLRELLVPAGGGELTDALRAELAAGNDAAWAEVQSQGGARRAYLAYDGDEPVAAGSLLFTEVGGALLSGGATAPHARGRGYYRALVRARWDAARAAGYEQLTTQASDESAPILAALGFTVVADLIVLVQTIPG